MNAALTAPTVSVSPTAVDTGQASTLSVTTDITGGTGPFSYQWMIEAPGGSYVALGTATSSATSPSTGSLTSTGTWHFELQVTDSGIECDGELLNVVTVTVNAALTAPTVSVSPTAVDTGQASTLSVTTDITGGTGPFSYQWMIEAPGGSYVALGTATSVQRVLQLAALRLRALGTLASGD